MAKPLIGALAPVLAPVVMDAGDSRLAQILAASGRAPATPANANFETLGSAVPIIDGAFGWYDATANITWIGYQVYTGGRRRPALKGYNHTAGKWTARHIVGNNSTQDDYHGVPHLFMDSNGFMHLYYGTHSLPQQFILTADARDMRDFVTQTNIGSLVSYPHAIQAPSGAIYFIYRYGTYASDNFWGAYIKSTGISAGVPTWGSSVTTFNLGTNSRYYDDLPWLVGNDIHVTFARADLGDNERKHVYYYIIDTTTDTIYNWDKSYSVAVGSLPIDLTTANANFRLVTHPIDGDTCIPRLYIDRATGDRWIAYSEGNGPWYPRYAYLPFGASSWTFGTVEIGEQMPSRYSNVTVTGSADGGVDFYWINDLTGNHASTYGGDMRKRHRAPDGTWGATETVLAYDAAARPLGSPFHFRDAHANARVVFFERTSDPDSLTGAGAARLFLYGDSGFITDLVDDYAFANSEASAHLARRSAAAVDDNERYWGLDNIFTVLKDIGISKFDAFYDLSVASDTDADALLNFIAATYTLTKSASGLTWVSKAGFTGDGAAGNLITGFTPSVALGAMQNNSGHIGAVALLNIQEDKTLIGGGTTFAGARNTSNARSFRVNQASSLTVTSITQAIGHHVASRTASNLIKGISNGVEVASAATASSGLSSTAITILGSNFSAQQVAFAHWGAGLTPAEVAKLYRKALRPLMLYRNQI